MARKKTPMEEKKSRRINAASVESPDDGNAGITGKMPAEDILARRLELFDYAIGHTLEEQLRKTLDVICEMTDSRIGFYHFVEADEKYLSLQAWSTRTEKEFCNARGKGRHCAIDQAGVWVDCVHERRPVIHNDYQSLPHRKGLPEGHAAVVRELVVPILRGGLIVAILGIGNKSTEYTEMDVAICQFLADVTWEIIEHKQVDEALRESEERMQLALEGGDLGTWDWNIRTGEVMNNERWAGMIGYRLDETRHSEEDWSILTHPDDMPLVRNALREHLEGRAPFYEIEHRMRHKSGEWIWVLDKGKVIARDADGNPLRMAGTHIDITARKRAEAQLIDSEYRYRMLFESNTDGLLIADIQTRRFKYANQRMCEMLGYTLDELLTLGVENIHPENDLPYVISQFEMQAKKDIRLAENIPCLRKDGTVFFTDINSTPLEIEGRLCNMGMFHDITERRRAEESLRQSEEQFRQSQKMEAVGRLAGGIAHDFNNMLTVINNYAEFAIAGLRPGDPLRSDIEEILKAGERSADLTRQLLAFSRRQALAPEILDMNQIITGIEPMLRRLIGEDIDLITYPDGGLGNVKADPGQIEQVIMNIVVNSRDAMPGGGKLTIETANANLDEAYAANHPEVTPGQYVMLSFTDTGCGMDAETIEHIFEPFYTTKELGKGTGLGLSTVYGIVKQSGGHTWVYSEPGVGTTFKIFLPREFSEADAADQEKKKAGPSTGTETILVVEDEPGVLNIIKRLLEASGYTVHTAANGGEALLVCEREGGSIQLMITDIVMPEISGRELSERLAKICPNMKVLYMSGYTEDAMVHHGILDHGINFVSKPFSVPDLMNKVRAVLDG